MRVFVIRDGSLVVAKRADLGAPTSWHIFRFRIARRPETPKGKTKSPPDVSRSVSVSRAAPSSGSGSIVIKVTRNKPPWENCNLERKLLLPDKLVIVLRISVATALFREASNAETFREISSPFRENVVNVFAPIELEMGGNSSSTNDEGKLEESNERWYVVSNIAQRTSCAEFLFAPSCIMNKASFPARSRIKREKDYSSATGGIID
ncbi:hypothetical protein K0M31_017432 [Melipona bicolor]|uniref:Uncharacterized protein n=1 Tax=Melipona bicolor TaxID=60889 RepID=A0AA40G583_9HYME|nr:hypothetical protein K0M31_017432 [Melipona bicolor]